MKNCDFPSYVSLPEGNGTWDDLGILKKIRFPRTVNPIIVRGNFLYDSVT